MVLNVSLPPDLEVRLRLEAERRGVSLDAMTVELLDKHLPHDGDARRAVAIAMLNDWVEEDSMLSDEAAAENAALLQAIDEHRASYRKLFENLVKDGESGSTGGA
jgi:hypothetical protein